MRTNVGARLQILLVAAAASLWSMPVLTQAPSARLSDKDIKALIEQVDEGRDKFEGNLDSQFKGATLKGPAGERKVGVVLQDYQDNTKKLKERFTADYSAGPEVATVLKQSTSIDTFLRGQASNMKGRSEWDRHAINLVSLAKAYGTVFPLPDGAVARRVNDKEAAGFAASIAAAGDRFKNDINKDATLAKPDKEAAKKDVELLVKQANEVKSRTGDGQPAPGEVRQLVEQIAKLQTFVVAHPSTGAANWKAVQASAGKLQQAFGLMP